MPFIRLENVDVPDPVEPPEGWHDATCTFDSHKWVVEIEEGKARFLCLDPCDIEKHEPSGRIPSCHWEVYPEDFHSPTPIPIKLNFVDDSTPSTPAGPAEYGFYIEVYPTDVVENALKRIDAGREFADNDDDILDDVERILRESLA